MCSNIFVSNLFLASVPNVHKQNFNIKSVYISTVAIFSLDKGVMRFTKQVLSIVLRLLPSFIDI